MENLFGTIIIYLYNIHKIQLSITFSHLLKIKKIDYIYYGFYQNRKYIINVVAVFENLIVYEIFELNIKKK